MAAQPATRLCHRRRRPEEYYCEPKSGGGAYISRGLRERAACGDGPLRFTGSAAFNAASESGVTPKCRVAGAEVFPELMKLDRSHRHALGEDFARSGDLTVFAPIEVLPTTRRRVPFTVELKNTRSSSRSRRSISSAIACRAAMASGSMPVAAASTWLNRLPTATGKKWCR